jgi:hypothetical protein
MAVKLNWAATLQRHIMESLHHQATVQHLVTVPFHQLAMVHILSLEAIQPQLLLATSMDTIRRLESILLEAIHLLEAIRLMVTMDTLRLAIHLTVRWLSLVRRLQLLIHLLL